MLKNIHIEHYKAFDKADVPIKPITVLLGANSVGKSSIIQLLLAMEQTAMVDSESYSSCLKLFGNSVNLGGAQNIFHKFDTNKPVSLSFTIHDDDLFQRITSKLDSYLYDLMRSIQYFEDAQTAQTNELPSIRKTRKSRTSTITKENYISAIENLKKTYLERYGKKKHPIYFVYDSLMQIIENDTAKLEKVFVFLEGLKYFNDSNFNSDFTYNFRIRFEEPSTLVVDGFSFLCGEETILSYNNNSVKDFVSSSFITFDNNEQKSIKEKFSNKSTLFLCFSDNNSKYHDSWSYYNKDILSAYVIETINEALFALRNSFKATKINHVSPLRANPKRYYMLDKANVTYSLDTFDGDAMAEVLKENREVKENVNKWLDKFELSVDVEEIKEVLHHLKVKQNGLNLDITDVGFGISQVLPIIIQGFLSRNDSLTIVEQPEIHLHPKMQADLADLFIDMVNSNDEKGVLIETHSEYLLRRLRRRISEGKISSDKVSICLFHPQTKEHGAEIEHLNIEEKGGFEWPDDFIGGELLEDVTEFLLHQ